jgi:hypothetical protein
VAVADDNGSGTGTVSECEEVNNEAILKQPFCE